VKSRQYLGELTAIRELSTHSAIWAGARFFTGEATAEFDPIPELQGLEDYRGGEYVAGYDFDSLDDRYFPRRGLLARLSYSSSSTGLGADQAFDQLGTTVLGARSWARHTMLGQVRYRTTLDGEAPYYADFRAGGPFALSGLNHQQLAGDHYAIAIGSWRYELSGGRGFFPAMAGLSLEYGNVGDDRGDLLSDAISAGSLYFGYRSPIGPLYWGTGFAEGGEVAYFLRIGDVFGGSTIGR
jgi:NTE family protein